MVSDRCPEAAMRAAMSDDEFWSYVLLRQRPSDLDLDDDQPDPPALASQERECAECGERGPCGYDAVGRPMIHAVTTEDDQ